MTQSNPTQSPNVSTALLRFHALKKFEHDAYDMRNWLLHAAELLAAPLGEKQLEQLREDIDEALAIAVELCLHVYDDAEERHCTDRPNPKKWPTLR